MARVATAAKVEMGIARAWTALAEKDGLSSLIMVGAKEVHAVRGVDRTNVNEDTVLPVRNTGHSIPYVLPRHSCQRVLAEGRA